MATRGDFDPLRQELLGVQKRMNDLFESALARTNFEASEGFNTWSPVCDVYETEASLVMCLELPGVAQEKMDIRLEGDELVVEGERELDRETSEEQYHRVERAYGRFSRRFSLPSTVDRGAVQASYRDGLLSIVLPKQTLPERRALHVEIR